MKKRLFSAMLTVFTVLSLFTTAALPITAADNPYTVFTDDPVYVELGTKASELWTGSITAQTTDLETVTFWLNVTDVTEPIYLVGTYFGFTTTDGSSFATHGTGSYGLQNNGFYIAEDGDYLISATLGKSHLAWNWTAENGYFASFTSFGAAAIDAASFDNDTSKVDTPAKVALMGIIEGEPAFAREVYYIAGSDILGVGAQTYTAGIAKGVDYNGNQNFGKDATLGFYKATVPYTAPELEGHTFTGWTDDYGRPAISLVSDYILAGYELFETNYTASLSTKSAGNSGKLTLKAADTDLGITSGSVSVVYDTEKFTFYADTDKDGMVTVDYSSISTDGTVGKLVYKITDNMAANTSITLTGTANVGSTAINVTATELNVNIASVFTGAQSINMNTVDENGDTVLPEAQALWSGEVALDEVNGVTLVYKIDGIDAPVNISNFGVGYECIKTDGSTQAKDNSAGWDYWWQKTAANELTFTEDGYYYIYINIGITGAASFTAVTSFNAFTEVAALSEAYAERNNENENATFEMLAVYADNMEVTVNYRNADGSLIASVPYKYTDVEGALAANHGNITGKLASAADIFAASEICAPTLPCYKLAGWADMNGNTVNAVYTDCDVYPIWELSENAEDHIFTTYVPNGDATCTADGTKTATCDNCAKATDILVDEDSMAEHVHEWTVTTKPTDTSEGTETGVCICGDMITRPVACLVPNDINGDGSVNIIDAEIIARYIAQNGESGTWDLSSCNLLTADRNSDGKVSQLDLSTIIAEIVAA